MPLTNTAKLAIALPTLNALVLNDAVAMPVRVAALQQIKDYGAGLERVTVDAATVDSYTAEHADEMVASLRTALETAREIELCGGFISAEPGIVRGRVLRD